MVKPLLAVGIFVFLMTLPNHAGSNLTSVYISVRSDGLPGSGTETDPFDGSTPAKFDALMVSLPANIQINLAAGTFLTDGGDAFAIKTGWTIKGSGMGLTTLKLAGHASAYAKHYNLSGGQLANVVLSDLTCDGNDQGWNWPAHSVVGGVDLSGTNITVENVEVINCYGDVTQGLEQFSILVCGAVNKLGVNCVIKNCVTHQYAPGSNYTNGPAFSYCINPQIIDCQDDGANHGFGFAQTTDAVISGCTTTAKTNAGFYTDTDSIMGLTIQNNSFAAKLIPIQFNSASPAQNVNILNNTFSSLNSTGGGSAAIVLSGASGNNFVIKGNVFSYLGTSVSGLILNNGQHFTNLDVEDNSSNVGLVGAGGSNADVTDVATNIEGNKFNLSLASLNPPPADSSGGATGTTSVGAPSEPGQMSSGAAATATPVNSVKRIGAKLVKPLSTATPGQGGTKKFLQNDPVAAAKEVESMPEGISKQTAVVAVIRKWARIDPPSAAKWVTGLPAGSQSEEAYLALGALWAAADSDGAADWISQLPEGSLRDAAVVAYSNQTIEADPDRAIEYVKMMSDTRAEQAHITVLFQKWMQNDAPSASVAVQNSSLPDQIKAELLQSEQ